MPGDIKYTKGYYRNSILEVDGSEVYKSHFLQPIFQCQLASQPTKMSLIINKPFRNKSTNKALAHSQFSKYIGFLWLKYLASWLNCVLGPQLSHVDDLIQKWYSSPSNINALEMF